MATYVGYHGGVFLNNGTTSTKIAELESFDLTVDRKFLTKQAFGESVESQIPGPISWSATCTGKIDPTDTTGQKVLIDHALSNAPQLLSFEFVVDDDGTGKKLKLTGQGYCTIRINSRAGELVEVTFEVKGASSLTPTYGT